MKTRIVILICVFLSSFVFAQNGQEDPLLKNMEQQVKNAEKAFTSYRRAPQKVSEDARAKQKLEQETAKERARVKRLEAELQALEAEQESGARHQEELDRIAFNKKQAELSRREKDSLRIVNKYLPLLEQAFDYTDGEEISLIIDGLLNEKFVPSVLIDTVRNYAIALGLAEPVRRGFLNPTSDANESFVQVVDKVNFFGDYGILPGWELYGDSTAYKSGRGWEIRGKLYPSYYKDSRASIPYPYTLNLVDKMYGYHSAVRKSDMDCVYSFYSYKRYHPTYKSYRPHTGTDYHTKGRKSSNPEGVYSEFIGVVRARKNDPEAGKSIVIRYFNGGEGIYKHMSVLGEFVPGDTVYPGDILGKIGNSGEHTTGEHLCYTFTFVGITLNSLYLTNWTDYLRIPDKDKEPQRYAQTLEFKEDLEEWHRGVPTGELCSPTIIIHEPGSAQQDKNVFICPSVDRCRIEIPGRAPLTQSSSNGLQASKP